MITIFSYNACNSHKRYFLYELVQNTNNKITPVQRCQPGNIKFAKALRAENVFIISDKHTPAGLLPTPII